MSNKTLKEQLSIVLAGKVLFVGIGNPLRSDDGVGPAVIAQIDGKIRAQCLDAGLAPENYIGKIVKLKPDTVVFIDAVHIDEAPGAIKIIQEADIPHYGFSTHNMSPKLMIENIESQIQAQVFMIGIQPQSIEVGEGLSDAIQQQVDFLYEVIIGLIGINDNEAA